MWLTKKSYYFGLPLQMRADKIFTHSSISLTAQWTEFEQPNVSGVYVSKHLHFHQAETGRSTGLWWIAGFILTVPQRRVQHEDSFEYELPACWSDLSGSQRETAETAGPEYQHTLPGSGQGLDYWCLSEGVEKSLSVLWREACRQALQERERELLSINSDSQRERGGEKEGKRVKTSINLDWKKKTKSWPKTLRECKRCWGSASKQRWPTGPQIRQVNSGTNDDRWPIFWGSAPLQCQEW